MLVRARIAGVHGWVSDFTWCQHERCPSTMESQVRSSKRPLGNCNLSWRVQGNPPALCQPFANPLPTLRQPFANPSPTFRQPLSKLLFPWAPNHRLTASWLLGSTEGPRNVTFSSCCFWKILIAAADAERMGQPSEARPGANAPGCVDRPWPAVDCRWESQGLFCDDLEC